MPEILECVNGQTFGPDVELRQLPSAIPEDKGNWYAVNKASEREAEVLIYEEIGSYGITAQAFVKDLAAITADRINVRLNTPGGEVFEGTAIHNALKNHPAKIIIHIDGVAASAGSFIAMSGDEIHMADNAYMMIHNARGGVMGEAGDMLTYADILEKIDGNIAQMYAEQSGNTPEHYRKLMNAETWFTAEEALEEGLIDSITKNAKTEPAPAKSKFDFTIYNVAKIPEPVKRLWGIQTTNKAPEASLRSEPEPLPTKEILPMAELSTSVAPAPIPAAPIQAILQDNPGPVDETANLRAMTAKGWAEQGRKIGVTEGSKQEMDRMRAIVDACPGKPEIAVAAFLAGQNFESVKLTFNAAVQAEAKMREMEENKNREITRLNALIACGGNSGVEMLLDDVSVNDERPQVDPKIQAEQEWDHKPGCRKGFTSKENYVNFRVSELNGQFVGYMNPVERA